MKAELHTRRLSKGHVNTLHVQITTVSCLPLCFISHLLDLTLYYVQTQQAVLS